MRDPQPVGDLLLGLLPRAAQSEAKRDDLPLPVLQLGDGGRKELPVHVVLDGPHDGIGIGAQHVAEKELVAVPVGVEGFVQADLSPLGGVFPEIHEDLVLNAPGGVGGQLDVLVRPVGVDGLDEADGADGDQVLDVDARVLEASGDIDHQPEVPLDEDLPGVLVSGVQAGQDLGLLLPAQGRREGVAAADVLDLPGPQKAQALQQPAEQGQRFTRHSSPPPFLRLRPRGRRSRRRRRREWARGPR